MISRVADHCFWLGRYLERAESTARLLQVTRALAFDAELPPLRVLAAGGDRVGAVPRLRRALRTPTPPATARSCSAT